MRRLVAIMTALVIGMTIGLVGLTANPASATESCFLLPIGCKSSK